MKVPNVNSCYPLLLSIGVVCALIMAATAFAEGPFKLRPGAKGELCLTCHANFKEVMKSRHLHPLMKKGECIGCHEPHTSVHKNLLTAGPTHLCYNCHKEVLPEKARSVHRDVAEGNCKSCHAPHGSDYGFLLTKPGNGICLDCHKEFQTQGKENRFKHASMESGKGCLNCHDPHASARLHALLKKDVPSLCLGCHSSDKSSFKSGHMNFSVRDTNCVSCHDVHGSNRKGLVYADAHAPVKEKKCMECHKAADSPKIFKTGKRGADLCQLCHKAMIDEVLNKKRVHWPLVDQEGCLHCHSPHAAKQKGLLKGEMSEVCGACHGDTVALQTLSRNNPKNENLCEPVESGKCTVCHSPHAADNVLLITPKSLPEGLCGRCHEWQTHSTHPIGEKVIDQRNKNLTLDCLSCHRACGTGNNPAMLHFPTTYELCIQCHADRRR